MKEIKEEKEEYLLIGRDFNARTGNGDGPIGTRVKKEEERRRSKDKTTNRERKEMLNKLEEKRQTILNGNYEKEGGWTYIGDNSTLVIDYVVANEKALEEVRNIVEGNKTESDHVPLEMELEGEVEEEKRKSDYIIKEKSIDIEDGVDYYHSKSKGWRETKNKNGEI